MKTEARRLRTEVFEERIKRVAGPVYQDWPAKISGVRGLSMRWSHRDFETENGIARRAAMYELWIGNAFYLMTVFELNYAYEFCYFGIEPDETSEECLDEVYERMLIMRALTRKPESDESV